MTPRRGRPPKPPDEVRTVRVTVLLTEREHATLLRACGGRGEATLLREAGLREAAEKAPSETAVLAWRPSAALAGALTSGLRVGKMATVRKLVAKAKAAGVPAKVVKR